MSTIDIQLAYNEDSSVLMEQLAQLDMPAFLDSAQAGVDILVASPIAYIKIFNGNACSSAPDVEFDGLGLFEQIKQLRNKYLAVSASNGNEEEEEGASDFRGGLIGFLAYPCLSSTKTDKYSLQFNDAYIGVYHWAITVDHRRRRSYLRFHQACRGEIRAGIEQRLSTFVLRDAASKPEPLSVKSSQHYEFTLESAFETQITRSEYAAAFLGIKDYINAGDCYQVNLTQRLEAKCSGHPFAAYRRLRRASKAPFSAYIHWGESALLSLSPERFLQLQGRKVKTEPIKGTRARAEDSEADKRAAQELLNSEKDRAENLMIVDLLRNDLGRVCETGSIKADQVFSLQSFSNVHHLVSTVTGLLGEGFDAIDLLQSCFPGGSITGAPKLRAMEIIEELEASERQIYCGTVFRIDDKGNLDSNIIIRSLLWQRQTDDLDHLSCWAGGGIVADSLEEAEYQECFDKINILIKELQSQL